MLYALVPGTWDNNPTNSVLVCVQVFGVKTQSFCLCACVQAVRNYSNSKAAYLRNTARTRRSQTRRSDLPAPHRRMRHGVGAVSSRVTAHSGVRAAIVLALPVSDDALVVDTSRRNCHVLALRGEST